MFVELSFNSIVGYFPTLLLPMRVILFETDHPLYYAKPHWN